MKLVSYLKCIIILLAIIIIMITLRKINIIEEFNFLPYQTIPKDPKATKITNYDGIKLQTKQITKHKWRGRPANKILKTNKPLKTYQGLTNSIHVEAHDGPLFDTSKPPVDIAENQKEEHNSMFLFRYNQFSPECCPSTFSSSKGCICTTDFQREFIARRGKLLK